MPRFCGTVTAIVFGLAAGTAAAHTGFILPDSFHYPECGKVGAIASFSDAFPAPEVALTSDAFSIISADGRHMDFDSVTADHAMTRLTATLNEPGSYRLTSGIRYGRTGRVEVTGGGFRRLPAEQDNANPSSPDAVILSSQAVSVSEVSISCGPDPEPDLRETQGRLSIRPLSIPDASTPQAFEILFDGAPFQTEELLLVPAYAASGGPPVNLTDMLAGSGHLDIGVLKPGLYTLLARHIATAPPQADTDLFSFSTALTFEIPAAPERR